MQAPWRTPSTASAQPSRLKTMATSRAGKLLRMHRRSARGDDAAPKAVRPVSMVIPACRNLVVRALSAYPGWQGAGRGQRGPGPCARSPATEKLSNSEARDGNGSHGVFYGKNAPSSHRILVMSCYFFQSTLIFACLISLSHLTSSVLTIRPSASGAPPTASLPCPSSLSFISGSPTT